MQSDAAAETIKSKDEDQDQEDANGSETASRRPAHLRLDMLLRCMALLQTEEHRRGTGETREQLGCSRGDL